MVEVMLTKLMPPGLAAGLLPRERLLNTILRDKNTRIVAITAPAGYGKTVLMLQLSLKLAKPLVWIQLDRYDNDPALLIRCLVEGLRQHFPGIGEKVLQLISQVHAIGDQVRLIVSLLINDLMRARIEPLLVLDDYHEITEPAVHALVQEMLEHFPPGVITMLASRTAIPLSLSRLYAAEAVQKVGAAELAFIREEIAALLADRYGPQPAHTVEEIAKQTGGWPAALQLAAPLLAGNEMPQPGELAGENVPLFDYLATEVLAKLAPLYREFLLESAVLEVLTIGQCNLLLEREDSAEILETLHKKLLLLVPLSGMENTYRCHRLLRDFLLARLGPRRVALHRRAGRLARLNGDIEMAANYFLQAGFDTEAEEVLEEAGRKVLAEGRWQQLARWLEQIPENNIDGNPWLSYYRAVVETYRGRLEEAERLAERAEAAFAMSAMSAGLAAYRLLQARLLRCRGRYHESLVMLEQVAAGLSKEEAAQRFDLILEKGLCLALLGEMRQADKILEEALGRAKKMRDAPAVTYLAETLGHLHYQQGRHALALRTYEEAIHFSADRSLPGYYVSDTISYIYRDWGELDKALETASKNVAAKERYRLLATLPSAYTALSYVYFEMGDFIRVEELIRKALELHYQYGAERYILLLNQVLLAWCRFARGYGVEAGQLLEETLAAAEEQVDLVCPLVQMMAGSVLALMGRLAEAGAVLRRAERNLEAMNFKTRLVEAYKALAYVCHATGDMKQFQKYARKFLHLGARLNFVGNALQPTAELLEPTLRFGLEQDVEVIYVQRLLVRLGRRSLKLLLELAEHPNPGVRQRIIAPLTELADEEATRAVTRLVQDSADSVRRSARASMRLTDVPPTADTAPAASPLLEVKTLGSFQLFTEGRELTGWRTRKTLELLGLLLHLQEPANKVRLTEELWPEADAQSSGALFRTTLYYLRRRLEQEGLPDLIHYHQDHYSLKPGACRLDCHSFEELVNTGLQEEPLREVGAGMLGRAIRLYRGDYMADPADYTWAVPRQVRLRQLYIEALLALARYYCSRRKYGRAQAYLLKLKEADPLSEPAHRLLLQVYAGLGNRQALVEEHRDFKMLLMDETGLPPLAETEELFRRLSKC